MTIVDGIDISERITRLLGKAELSYAELSAWLDRSPATVYSWANGTRKCRRLGRGANVLERLKLLERLTGPGKEFPIPCKIPQNSRGDYARQVFERHAKHIRNH